MLKINQKNLYIIYLSIIPILSLVNSIIQGIFAYDGFHWGLVLFSADGMLKNLTPYKDLFIHYGLLTTKLNSILLDIFKNNFIYIFIISSLAYASSLFIMGLFFLRFTNIYFSIIGLIIIFLFTLLLFFHGIRITYFFSKCIFIV